MTDEPRDAGAAAGDDPATGDDRATADDPAAGDDRATAAGVVGADGETARAPSTVRPYALVRGRTRVRDDLDLSLEALVQGLVAPVPGLTPEERRILDLTSGRYETVAELSARLRLPLGVVRVVVSDLADRGCVRVHSNTLTTVRTAAASDPTAERSLLESVIDGIATL